MNINLYLIEHINNGTWLYFVYDGVVHIEKYTGTAPVVEIPAEIGGKPVTQIYNKAFAYAAAFGLDIDSMPQPDHFLREGDEVLFGNQRLKVFYTPGHCDGSICLYSADNKVIFTGDLIFELCVGRSDLPTGNEALLQQSIQTTIFTLEDDVTILSGHGGPTTVGHERRDNSYIWKN